MDGGVSSFPEGQRGLMAKGLGWSRKLPKDLAPDRWADHSQDVQDVVGPGFWEGTKRGAAEEGRVKGSGHSKPCEGRGHETQV